METVEINGVTYKIARSTYWSDHSALHMSYDGGKTYTNENNIWREYGNIAADPNQLLALKKLWPEQFK